MSQDHRLTELEIALTHQEALVEDLNTIVRDQADRLDRLEARLFHLATRLAEAEASLPGDGPEAHQPPPHY